MDNNSFFSIDRLVDFGMSMTVANQMMRTMNSIMNQTVIPGAPRSIPQMYYIAIKNKAIGPINEGEISQLISQKKINKDTLAWMPGMTSWNSIENIPAILKIVALTPPPLPKDK
jgi:hypothetical protein